MQKIELASEVKSCSIARRFVQESLADAPDDLRDDASLLISEVVTNALLHAKGLVRIEVEERGGAYRIAVSDDSSAPPTQKGYRTDDATGRGLQLLDGLATSWGWEWTRPGKVVWFELGGPTGGASSPTFERRSYEDPYPDGIPIALLEAPVEEMIRTGAHYDALYREFRLILELDGNVGREGRERAAHGLNVPRKEGQASREGLAAGSVRTFILHRDPQVDRKWFSCEGTNLCDHIPDCRWNPPVRAKRSQSTEIRDRRCQSLRGQSAKRALNDWIVDCES